MSRFNFRSASWGMTSLALLAMLLFVSLGSWQISRGRQKTSMLREAAQQQQLAPIVWQPGMKHPIQYQKIKVRGHYLPQTLLLDNQYDQHQLGYHVVNALLLNNGKVLLVDRGWIAQHERHKLPQITVPTSVMDLVGSAYYPSKGWVLGQALERKSEKLWVIEALDTPLIRQTLHKSVYPFIMRLDEQAAFGFERHWTITAMPATRHYGYAFQWFAMACAVLAIYVGLTIKKNHEQK